MSDYQRGYADGFEAGRLVGQADERERAQADQIRAEQAQTDQTRSPRAQARAQTTRDADGRLVQCSDITWSSIREGSGA